MIVGCADALGKSYAKCLWWSIWEEIPRRMLLLKWPVEMQSSKINTLSKINDNMHYIVNKKWFSQCPTQYNRECHKTDPVHISTEYVVQVQVKPISGTSGNLFIAQIAIK